MYFISPVVIQRNVALSWAFQQMHVFAALSHWNRINIS